jgi:hypothetical protein
MCLYYVYARALAVEGSAPGGNILQPFVPADRGATPRRSLGGGGELPCVPAPIEETVRYDSCVWCRKNVLDWNGSLPWDMPSALVRCKSVFTSTGWTIRPLSPQELKAAFDVPTLVSNTLSDAGTVECFTMGGATPTKLLTHAIQGWSGLRAGLTTLKQVPPKV